MPAMIIAEHRIRRHRHIHSIYHTEAIAKKALAELYNPGYNYRLEPLSSDRFLEIQKPLLELSSYDLLDERNTAPRGN